MYRWGETPLNAPGKRPGRRNQRRGGTWPNEVRALPRHQNPGRPAPVQNETGGCVARPGHDARARR